MNSDHAVRARRLHLHQQQQRVEQLLVAPHLVGQRVGHLRAPEVQLLHHFPQSLAVQAADQARVVEVHSVLQATTWP